MKTKSYKLYAAPVNPDTMSIAMNTPYARICGRYALVYKTGRCPAGYKLVVEPILSILSDDDRKWVDEVNTEILENFAIEHQESVRKGVMVFADRFESALKTQREEMEAEKNGN